MRSEILYACLLWPGGLTAQPRKQTEILHDHPSRLHPGAGTLARWREPGRAGGLWVRGRAVADNQGRSPGQSVRTRRNNPNGARQLSSRFHRENIQLG